MSVRHSLRYSDRAADGSSAIASSMIDCARVGFIRRETVAQTRTLDASFPRQRFQVPYAQPRGVYFEPIAISRPPVVARPGRSAVTSSVSLLTLPSSDRPKKHTSSTTAAMRLNPRTVRKSPVSV